MRLAVWIRTGLFLGVLTAAGAAAAQSQSPPPAGEANAVAVLPLEVVGNVPAGRPALEAAVLRGLTMFAGPTIEATQASARLSTAGAKLPCEDAACWTAAGKAVGARHLVAGRVERKGANFEVLFRLLDGNTGRVLATETNKCEATDCSVAELTRQTVRELARQMLSETSATAAAPVAPASNVSPTGTAAGATAPGAPSDQQPLTTLLRSEGASESDSGVPRWVLPTALVAAGAGAAVAGVFLIRRDGKCIERAPLAGPAECNTYRESMWEGVTATGAGVALLATGVTLFVLGRQSASDDPPPVAIGPGSLFLQGRF